METSDPKSIIVLRSASGRPSAKQYRRDADGVTVIPYAKERLWHVEVVPLDGLDSLAAVLGAVCQDSTATIIRASMQPGTTPPEDGVLRRLVENGGPWQSCPRQWIAFDFDDYKVPDDLTVPEHQIMFLREQLPEMFHAAGCWWQFTSSHKMKGSHPRVWARLWFWLDAPLSDRAAANLMQQAGADASLARPVQVHYIANPIFTGVEDPVRPRTGLLPGGEVPVAHYIDEAKRLLVTPRYDPVLRDFPHEEAPASEIDAVKERLRAQVVLAGGRHFHALGVAGELLRFGIHDEDLHAFLEDLLRAGGRPPAAGEVAGAIAYAKRKQAQGQWVDKGTLPRSVLLTDAPAQQVPAADNAEVIEPSPAMAFGKDERPNAKILWLQDAEANPWVMSNGQFYRWEEDRYVVFDKETLYAHISERVQKNNKICNATAECFSKMVRDTWRKKDIVAPCILPTGTPAPPYVQFTNGNLWVNDWLAGKQPAPVPADAKLFTTSRPAVPFDAKAKCPLWHKFLDSVWGDDPQQRRELQKMFGYLMTPMTKMQKSFWLIGASNGGKGTICAVLKALAGADNTHSMRWSDFSQEFGAQRLPGKTLCIVDEANESKEYRIPMQAIDFIKSVVGEGETQINRKNKDHYAGLLPVRFVFSANEFPSVMDSSGAFGRRVHLFVFHKTFATKADTDLKDKLLAELPGIAQWALAGLRLLLHEDGKFLDSDAAKDRWELLNRRMARTAHAVTTFVAPARGATLDVRLLRDVLTHYHRAEGWEKADVPVPRLAEQVITQLGTLGHNVRAVTQPDGRTLLRGATLTDAARQVLADFGQATVDLSIDPLS